MSKAGWLNSAGLGIMEAADEPLVVLGLALSSQWASFVATFEEMLSSLEF